MRPWRRAVCSTPPSAGRASIRRSRRACTASRRCRASGRPASAPTAIAAACTPSSGARRRTRPSIVFDAPDGTSACTRRNRSNTPLQALTLLNDQGFFEFAQALARRTLTEAPAEDDARIGHAFRLCLGREPQPRERDVLLRLLAKERTAYRERPDEAKALAPMEPPQGVDAAEFAAWTTVARVLLNLDEFVTRE